MGILKPKNFLALTGLVKISETKKFSENGKD